MKKRVFTLLTAAAVLSASVYASAAVVFSDINNVPWEGAKTYIQNVADLGLMVGEKDEQGTNIFRAKDRVTYCETLQLVYNLLKNAGVATPSTAVTSKWQSILAGYDVPKWNYEAAAYALENGIISTSEVRAFMSGSGGKSIDATRQDVAIMFGRGLSAVYDIEKSPTLTFNDSDDITSVAAPYVKLLSDLNILVGDDNKNFNPKTYINRAEMAVMVSKTNTILGGGEIPKSATSITGTIIDVSVNTSGVKTITLKDSNGSTKQFKGTASTPVSYNGKSSSFMDLTAGDNVTVTYSGSDVTGVVLNFDFIEKTDEYVTGTINYMSSGRITVNHSDGTSGLYDIIGTTYITLNGKAAEIGEITSIIDNGVPVNVKILTNGSTTALSIEATGEAGTVMGTISDISRTAIDIKRTGGNVKTYKYASDIAIRYDGNRVTIPVLMEAHQDGKDIDITAKLNSEGEISELTATINVEGGTTWGIVKGVSDEKINMYSGSSTVSYYYADGVEATLDGDSVSISQLDKINESGKEFTATLYLNTKGKVTKIEAVLEDSSSGKITNLTDSYIEIETSYGKAYKYYLDDSATVKFSGSTNEDIEDLMAVYEKGKTEVKLEFNSKDLVSRIVAYVDWSNFKTVYGDIDKASSTSITIDGTELTMDNNTTVYIDGVKAVNADVASNYVNGIWMDAEATAVDSYIKKLDVTIEGAEGTISGMENGYITIKGASKTTKFPVAKSEDLTVKVDSVNSSFNELYDKWNNLGIDYKVTLNVKDGTVTRIIAERI